MCHRILRPALAALLTATAWLAVAAQAQQPPAATPAPRAAPRPDQLDPAVDTSKATDSATGAAAPAAPPAAAAPVTPPPATPAATGKAPAATTTAPKGAARKGAGNDRLNLDTTDVRGNHELPKVMYIVPWKHSDLGDLVGRPPNSLLDEVLQPLDRDVFKRETRYYEALRPDQAGAKSDAVQGSDAKP
jgi:hypothetical protein